MNQKDAQEIISLFNKFKNLETLQMLVGYENSSFELTVEDIFEILSQQKQLKNIYIPLFSYKSSKLLELILSMENLHTFGIENNCQINSEELDIIVKLLNHSKVFHSKSKFPFFY
jgi:hypothetical protein